MTQIFSTGPNDLIRIYMDGAPYGHFIMPVDADALAHLRDGVAAHVEGMRVAARARGLEVNHTTQEHVRIMVTAAYERGPRSSEEQAGVFAGRVMQALAVVLSDDQLQADREIGVNLSGYDACFNIEARGSKPRTQRTPVELIDVPDDILLRGAALHGPFA